MIFLSVAIFAKQSERFLAHSFLDVLNTQFYIRFVFVYPKSFNFKDKITFEFVCASYFKKDFKKIYLEKWS